METINEVFQYDCPKEEWKRFIEAKNSGQTFEIDEEMFFYWLEVLPPVYMAKIQEIDGEQVPCSFGFAEGREYVTDFWRKDGRFFGKQSTRMNHAW